MVLFKCPNCGRLSETVSTIITIQAKGHLVVRTGRRGITFHASGDLQMLDATLHTNAPDEYVCPHCTEAIPADVWFYVFVCDRCHGEIQCPVDDWEDANAFARAHRCGDGSTGIKCFSCWRTMDRGYCRDCKARKECPGYGHFHKVEKEEGKFERREWRVDLNGSSEERPEQPRRRRNRRLFGSVPPATESTSTADYSEAESVEVD